MKTALKILAGLLLLVVLGIVDLGLSVPRLEDVSEVEIGKRFAFDLDTEPFLGHTRVDLRASEGGTTVVATNEFEGKNLVWAAVLRLSKAMFEQQSQESDDLLASTCEASGG